MKSNPDNVHILKNRLDLPNSYYGFFFFIGTRKLPVMTFQLENLDDTRAKIMQRSFSKNLLRDRDKKPEEKEPPEVLNAVWRMYGSCSWIHLPSAVIRAFDKYHINNRDSGTGHSTTIYADDILDTPPKNNYPRTAPASHFLTTIAKNIAPHLDPDKSLSMTAVYHSTVEQFTFDRQTETLVSTDMSMAYHDNSAPLQSREGWSALQQLINQADFDSRPQVNKVVKQILQRGGYLGYDTPMDYDTPDPSGALQKDFVAQKTLVLASQTRESLPKLSRFIEKQLQKFPPEDPVTSVPNSPVL